MIDEKEQSDVETRILVHEDVTQGNLYAVVTPGTRNFIITYGEKEMIA
jgi:hypothetical protein